jgi:diguanylate cyclase (GGDEF)-like protein/PAS domain S-box-containing protein
MNNLPERHPANSQTQRLPGMSREAALYEQLYRYAEDLKEILEGQEQTRQRYESLRASFNKLNDSHTLLDNLIQKSHDIHIVTDPSGVIRQANQAAAALAPLATLNEQLLCEWILPSHQENYVALREQALDPSGEPAGEMELHLRSVAGDSMQLIASAQVFATANAQGTQLHWVMRDITTLRETEFETQISSMVFQNAAEGVLITDIEGIILSVNPAFTQITGYTKEEIVGQRPSKLKSGIQNAGFYEAFWRHLREEGGWQGEIYNRKKNGEIYPQWLTINAARDSDGRILSYIAVFSDLSKLLQTEKHLAHLALHDALTDLPNRLLLQERLSSTLAQSKRSASEFTLIFIDLDHFKPINDLHGHDVGDLALREAANRLAGTLREMDTVARLGGDEFVILAPGLAGAENIGRVCHKVLEAFAPSFWVGGKELSLGASLGCAEYPRHGQDGQTLLKNADSAMYRAKSAGGNGYEIFAGTVSTAT